MNTLKVTRENNYAIVQLDRGSANPINTEMLKDLLTCFNDLASNSDIHGVILTGKERFFSAGLDVIELYAYDEHQVLELFESLFSAIKTMLSFPKPLVGSITGHSPAGGCVLALCCDYRIMAEGKYRIGLNEVPVGIVLPKFIYHLYENCVGSRRAMQFILEGKLLSVTEALDNGLIDECVEEGNVLEAAKSRLLKYLSFNQRTWTHSKSNMRTALLAHYVAFDEPLKAEISKHWWSEDTRKILGDLVLQLSKK